MELPEGLFEDVKNYLNMNWDDVEDDKKLDGIIQRGMRYVNSAGGKEYNYAEEGKARELLLDYCRYARANALDEFQENYLHELLTLQIQAQVSEAANDQG